MNYIKRLQSEVAELQADKRTALETLTDLRVYLASDKFTSMAAGDRRFLVNTMDIEDRIRCAILACLP